MTESIFFFLIKARSGSKGFKNNNTYITGKQIVGQTQKIYEELL